MKVSKNKGITLVALIVTIIILLILAGISISTLTNTGIFEKVKESKRASENAEKEQNQVLDEYENELNNYIPTPISKTEKKVGYYADIDDDGIIDGVIYADLAVGNTGNGQWSDEDGNYSIPIKTHLKEYYVSKKNYDDKFGIENVISPIKNSTGEDRFYVMSLTDIEKDNKNNFDWYNAAYEYKMEDYESTTSGDFGTGKNNTATMISRWNSKAYGDQDKCLEHRDVWGQIQKEVDKGWFLPSRGEWSAFTKEIGVNLDDYKEKGLNDWYWSSSQRKTNNAFGASFGQNYIGYNNVNQFHYVRLSITF